MKELIDIQNELKVLKDTSKPGIQFLYRTCDQIFQEVKPLCKKHGVLLIVFDEVELIGERYYIKSTAMVKKGDMVEMSTGYAREPDKLMSMSYPQITGSCSSYARKTALGGLFSLDDNHDPDGDDKKGNNSQLITEQQIKILTGYAKDFQNKDNKKHSFIVSTIADTTLTKKEAEKIINRIKVSKT